MIKIEHKPEVRDAMISVFAEIADKRADLLGQSRRVGLLAIAEEMGVTKMTVSIWFHEGVPVSREQDLRKLLKKYDVEVADDLFQSFFSPARHERGENATLIMVLDMLPEYGESISGLAEKLGISRFTLRRCAYKYGGLPETYDAKFREAISEMKMSLNEAEIKQCFQVGYHPAWSLRKSEGSSEA